MLPSCTVHFYEATVASWDWSERGVVTSWVPGERFCCEGGELACDDSTMMGCERLLYVLVVGDGNIPAVRQLQGHVSWLLSSTLL